MTNRKLICSQNKATLALKKAKEAVQADAMRLEIFEFCRSSGLPLPNTEYLFCANRRWRFDYAWIERHIALEIEGGIFTGGRHVAGKGFLGDMEKYNAAAFLGWKVFRFTPSQILSGGYQKMLKVNFGPKNILINK